MRGAMPVKRTTHKNRCSVEDRPRIRSMAILSISAFADHLGDLGEAERIAPMAAVSGRHQDSS